MSETEVWPNAPLALVAVEARFPSVGNSPLRPPTYRAIRDVLGEGWVLENDQAQTVEFEIGPGGVKGQRSAVEHLTRVTVRDRTRVVTVRPESLTVEVTSYMGYADFRQLLASVFRAVENVMKPEGLVRLGMRYIDEIRVPQPGEPDPWDEWLDPALLAPRADGMNIRGWNSAVQYETGPDRKMVLRYGPADRAVVAPAGSLKRAHPPKPGPLFVLDFDSFWEPSGIPAFAEGNLLKACDELRAPEKRLFEQLVSPKLVEEVFRRENET
jgi:uncharacterized protein (TIGR04255 family)